MIGRSRSRWSEIAALPACLALIAAIATARSSIPADPVGKPSALESPAVIVHLSADGRLTRDGEPVAPERLGTMRADGSEIVLRIAADCRGSAVRPALERLRKAGLDGVRVEEAPR